MNSFKLLAAALLIIAQFIQYMDNNKVFQKDDPEAIEAEIRKAMKQVHQLSDIVSIFKRYSQMYPVESIRMFKQVAKSSGKYPYLKEINNQIFYSYDYFGSVEQLLEREDIVQVLLGLPPLLKMGIDYKYLIKLVTETKSEKFKIFLTEKLVLQGQTGLIVEQILHNPQFEYNPKNSFNKKIQTELVIEAFKQSLIPSLAVENPLTFLTDCILFNAFISDDRLLLQLILRLQLDLPQLFLQILYRWSDEEFIRYAAIQTQIMITNLLCALFPRLDNSHPEYTLRLVNTGIELRINLYANYQHVRMCGLVMWNHFVKFLNLPDHSQQDEQIPDRVQLDGETIIELNQKAKKEEYEKEEETPKVEEDNEEEYPQDNHAPKSLLDCLYALKSDVRERIESTLKHLPYLIRKRLSNVRIYATELIDLLMKYSLPNPIFRLNLEDQWKQEWQEKRNMSLVALIITIPTLASEKIINKLFSDDTNLGEKMFLIQILTESSEELSSNPNRYQVEQFDEYKDNQEFYFQKVSTKYYDENTQKKLPPKTRVWGHTKKKFDRKDLKILGKQDEAFENKFHQYLENLFYPVVIRAESKFKLLFRRETLFLSQFIGMIIKMVDCAKNSLQFYRVIEEVVEFQECFKSVYNIEVVKQKLRLWAKISVLLKKDVLKSYPVLVQKILQQLEDLNCNIFQINNISRLEDQGNA